MSITELQNNKPSLGAQSSEALKKAELGTAGSGIVKILGPVPGVEQMSYSAILGSLTKLMPEISGDDLDVLLVEISMKLKESEEAAQKDRIIVDQEKKRSALGEKREKLEEATKKIEEAAEARDSVNIWDKIKVALQAVAAALMIVAGAILLAVPGLQAVGALMIAAGVLTAIMTVDSIVQMTTGKGMIGNIVSAMGGSEDMVMGFDMGARVGLAVAGIGLSVGMFFVPGGQVASASTIAQAVGTIAQATSAIGSASLTAATAAGDTAATAVRYEAAQKQSDAQKLQADGKDLEAFMQQLDDLIDQALARLIGSTERGNAMLDAITDAIQDRGNTLARAKFGI